MSIAEVTAWDATIKGNIAHHPTGPAGDRAVQTSTSFRELQAAIARWRDTVLPLSGGTITGSLTVTGAVTVNGAFTSLGIDDNATAERFQVSDTALVMGAAGINFNLVQAVNDRQTVISGGNSSASGGNIQLYGGTEATTGDVRLRNDSNSFLHWDESLGSLAISTGSGAKTLALTINSAQQSIFGGSLFLPTGTALAYGDTTVRITGSNVANLIEFYTNNILALTLGATQITTFGSHAILPAAKILYLDGGSNTYIQENSADSILFVTGGATAMSLNADQTLDIPKHIGFPATQVASAGVNDLDDYEEGTWTPGITFGGGSTGITYTLQTASYQKVGDRVHCYVQFLLSNKGSSTGAVNLTGLPFTTASGEDKRGSGIAGFSSAFSTVADGIVLRIEISSTIAIMSTYAGSGTSSLTDANFTNTSHCIIDFSYRV